MIKIKNITFLIVCYLNSKYYKYIKIIHIYYTYILVYLYKLIHGGRRTAWYKTGWCEKHFVKFGLHDVFLVIKYNIFTVLKFWFFEFWWKYIGTLSRSLIAPISYVNYTLVESLWVERVRESQFAWLPRREKCNTHTGILWIRFAYKYEFTRKWSPGMHWAKKNGRRGGWVEIKCRGGHCLTWEKTEGNKKMFGVQIVWIIINENIL